MCGTTAKTDWLMEFFFTYIYFLLLYSNNYLVSTINYLSTIICASVKSQLFAAFSTTT